MHIEIASVRQFKCLPTTYVTEIKDTYFEIYTKQVACPLAFLYILNCQLKKKKKKKKKTPAVKFLDLIFAITFLFSILAKCVRDEKYSGTSPPTSPNGSNILDAAGSYVHRCTL